MQITAMLGQSATDLDFVSGARQGLPQEKTQQFLKTTNAIYAALQSMFGQQVHRDVVARELTSQLGDWFPVLIIMLKEGLE